MRAQRYAPALAISLLLLSASRAEAHTMMSTAGPFYAGVKHFFFSLDDVLCAFAVGLMASLRKDAPGSTWAAVALPASWIALGILGLWLTIAPITGEAASAVSLIVLGVLVAADRKLPVGAILVLAIGAGGLHGFLNGLSVREVGMKPGFWQLVGITVSSFFVTIYPTAILDLMKKPWIRVVVRVLGSWIAAIGLLLLGWAWRAAHAAGS